MDTDMGNADQLDELDEDEYEDEAPDKIPTTVLGPLMFLAVPALGFAALGIYALTGPATRSGAVVWLAIGAVLGAIAIGLWRRSRVAHSAAYVIAGIVALSVVGLVITIPIVWCLQMRDAKDWFGIR